MSYTDNLRITFSEATATHLPLIQTLAEDIWRLHYPSIITSAQIEYMLEKMYSSAQLETDLKNGYRFLILEHQMRPIGFMGFRFETESRRLFLSKLYVSLAFHGKGIGHTALERLCEEARGYNATAIYLFVNKRNEKALRAYLRFGFSIEAEVVTDIGNGFVMDDFRLMIPM